MAMKTKIGYGAKDDIEQALTAQTLDSGDIIFTSDTEEFAFVKPDGTVMYPKSRDLIFESVEEAEDYIEANPDSVYPGQTIIIKTEDGNYNSHTIQPSTEGEGGSTLVIDSGTSAEAIEQAKQEAIAESKSYVDSALTVVEF